MLSSSASAEEQVLPPNISFSPTHSLLSLLSICLRVVVVLCLHTFCFVVGKRKQKKQTHISFFFLLLLMIHNNMMIMMMMTTTPDHSNNDGSSMSDVWWMALGSTITISLAPFLFLFLLPDLNHNKSLLKVLLSFASGGLLGDAFLHLIPHALMMQQQSSSSSSHHHHGHHHHSHGHHDGHDDGHSHPHDMSVGLWVLAGIFSFLLVEKMVRITRSSSGSSHGHSHHHHDHDHHHDDLDDDDEESQDENDDDVSLRKRRRKAISDDQNKKKERRDKIKKKKNQEEREEEEMSVGAYLNLAADFAHNFTDGLAIGASYVAGGSLGIMTTITILFHEVPHEVGDMAILIQSGCSTSKAMWLQLLTAVGAVAGTLTSLLSASTASSASASSSTTTSGSSVSSWILPFTAGGFIYVATVSVIPDLLHSSSSSSSSGNKSVTTRWTQLLCELLALVSGVGIMVLIAQYE